MLNCSESSWMLWDFLYLVFMLIFLITFGAAMNVAMPNLG